MKRQDLIKAIVETLLDEQVLNEADYNSVEDLLQDVEQIIEDKLQDYTLVRGEAI